ncbi:IS5 family transposase [Luteibacter sp. Sphag1AF]|nr:IS5 family transposase [Luteibacter sp. Sphag1AF]
MPDQLTLATQADRGFEAHRKPTPRDGFLAEMDKVVPWSEVCAAVEHPLRVVRRQFGHVKARYRGLARNGAPMLTLFTLSNVWMVRERLQAQTG